MRPDSRFCVAAHLSDGTILTYYSESITSIGSWKEGVNQAAAAFGHRVLEFVFVQSDTPKWECAC